MELVVPYFVLFYYSEDKSGLPNGDEKANDQQKIPSNKKRQG